MRKGCWARERPREQPCPLQPSVHLSVPFTLVLSLEDVHHCPTGGNTARCTLQQVSPTPKGRSRLSDGLWPGRFGNLHANWSLTINNAH